MKKNSMSKVIHSECTDSASDSAGDIKRRSRNKHDSGKEAKNSLRNKDSFYCGSVKSKCSSEDYTEYSFSEDSDGHFQKGYKKEGFRRRRKDGNCKTEASRSTDVRGEWSREGDRRRQRERADCRDSVSRCDVADSRLASTRKRANEKLEEVERNLFKGRDMLEGWRAGDRKKTQARNSEYDSADSGRAEGGKKRDSSKECSKHDENFSIRDLKEAWRKDLKIKGQIGKIGDKDKLDFASLKRQVDAAKLKGYKDQEVVEAVLNATTAGSDIRALLQNMRDLSLDSLMEILRSYFQELDEGDMLQKLATAQQGNSEDPQAFIIRILALKNKIINDAECGSGLSEEAVSRIMCKSLETGIWSENIRNRMRPVLSLKHVSDARLLKEISLAVQSEKQRKEKFNSKRQLRVSFLEEGDANREDLAKEIGILKKEISQVKQEEVNKREQEQEVKDVELLKLITELKGEVAELRTRDRSKGSRWTYGCNNCKKDGTPSLCNHCFRCGSTDHKIKDCPKASNSSRPLIGDNQ